jgi:hypothetical protein
MSRQVKLSTLLRARQAQEDVAKGLAFRARTASHDARHSAGARVAALHASSPPADGTGRAVVAAIAARQALAAAAAAARDAALAAEQRAAVTIADLAEAARHRRAAERLVERVAAAQLREDRLTDQRAVDEIGARMRFRMSAEDSA